MHKLGFLATLNDLVKVTACLVDIDSFSREIDAAALLRMFGLKDSRFDSGIRKLEARVRDLDDIVEGLIVRWSAYHNLDELEALIHAIGELYNYVIVDGGSLVLRDYVEAAHEAVSPVWDLIINLYLEDLCQK